MKDTDPELSLATLDGGAALAKFDYELQEIAKNISDPNTSETASREITLKLKLKPDANRRMVTASIQVMSKTSPPKPSVTSLMIAQTRTGPVMSEVTTKQEDLFIAASAAAEAELKIRFTEGTATPIAK